MYRFCLVLLCLWSIACSAQTYEQLEQRLTATVARAQSDAAAVDALGKLAEFYYLFKAGRKGDSVLQQQLTRAELSTNPELILATLFGPALDNISIWTDKDVYQQATVFLDKALAFAHEQKNENHLALAHIKKAALLRKRGEYDKALAETTQALSVNDEEKTDSIKVLLYTETGDIFLAKGQAATAYKQYNKAFDVAYSAEKVALQSKTLHHIADLYFQLQNNELAKSTLLKSLDLNTTSGDAHGRMDDYHDLARVTDRKEYIDAQLQLADSLNHLAGRLQAKSLMFYYHMVVGKNGNACIQYLQSNPDFRIYLMNGGLGYYYWNIGNAFRYGGNLDSALHYFYLAKESLQKNYDRRIQMNIMRSLGTLHMDLKRPQNAAPYLSKALELSLEMGDVKRNSEFTGNLSSIFAQLGDYKQAHAYQARHLAYRDTLEKIQSERDVALLEVQRVENQRVKDLQRAEEEMLRTRNLQWIGIAAVIGLGFLGMLVIGMFPVSRFTIRMLSFFAFICLFEFFIILIDTFLHKFTHGEPMKLWLIKIFLIAAMVPFQHFLEHGLVRFLESRRLLKLKQQFSIQRILNNLKKEKKHEDAPNFEQDTAVL